MVALINGLTGSTTYVAEDRVEEYLEAGHKLASAPKSAPKSELKKTAKKSSAKGE